MTWNQIAKWGVGAALVIAALIVANRFGLDVQTILDVFTYTTENSQ